MSSSMDPNNNNNNDEAPADVKSSENKENAQPATCKYKTVRPANVAITNLNDNSAQLSPYGAPESAGTYEVIPHRVFVGGFSTDTTEDDLRECFKNFGEIREIKIVRASDTGVGKGYGFITFESDEEARAVRTSNERYELHGRRLNLGPAMRRIYQHRAQPAPLPSSPTSQQQQAPMPYPVFSYPVPMMPMFYGGPNAQFYASPFLNPNTPPQQQQQQSQQFMMGGKREEVRKRSPPIQMLTDYMQQQQQTPGVRASLSAGGGPLNSAPMTHGAKSRLGAANLAPLSSQAINQQQQQAYYQEMAASGKYHQAYDQDQSSHFYWPTPGDYQQQQHQAAYCQQLPTAQYDNQNYWM